ncbi:lactoylglutathione lyase [Jeotgalibaca ciconiae]|uniref:Aldoketomutase n=1 Tax=Jeotgalibaca ciconiae TaxID=2496265 RepID=A0A3Q9BKT0_9LACT|nr:VOC family protein [Jeotgalibaca ciconiae]AZP03292.1 lactoylglutathione lyase [Jeotgalibaca ciconiae]
MKMVHTCVRVKNLEESLAFYKEAFGFQEVNRKDYPEHKFTLVYLSLENDPYQLELTYNFDHDAYDLGDGYGHIAIAVDDVPAAHQKHREAGLEVTDLKGLPNSEFRYYFVMDPDGYKIEVVQDR